MARDLAPSRLAKALDPLCQYSSTSPCPLTSRRHASHCTAAAAARACARRRRSRRRRRGRVRQRRGACPAPLRLRVRCVSQPPGHAQFEVCSQKATGAPVTCCCPYQGAKVAKAYTAKVYSDPAPPKYTDNTQARPRHAWAMCIRPKERVALTCACAALHVLVRQLRNLCGQVQREGHDHRVLLGQRPMMRPRPLHGPSVT